MKRTKLYIFISIIFLCTVRMFAGAEIYGFQGRSDGSGIILEWKTGSETNLRYFVVVRNSLNSNNITEIGRVYPQGDNSYYSFRDDNVYKTNGSLYSYSLKIVDNNSNQTWIPPVTVSGSSLSGVKRTWGSIKALFR